MAPVLATCAVSRTLRSPTQMASILREVPGTRAHLAAKAKGNNSMRLKRAQAKAL